MRVDFSRVYDEHWTQTNTRSLTHSHACTRKNNLGGFKASVEIDHVTKWLNIFFRLFARVAVDLDVYKWIYYEWYVLYLLSKQ